MALDGTGREFTQAGAVAATIATITGALTLSAIRGRRRSAGVSLMGIDHAGKRTIPQQSLQWWPDTLSDSIATGWSEKVIPGGSHALMQWGGNAGRSIAFNVKMSRSMRYIENFNQGTGFGLGDNSSVPLTAQALEPENARNVKNNIDIKRMIYYLRAYCYPDYDGQPGTAVPPVICILDVPGFGLNEDGRDSIFSVMTGCDMTYQKAFTDGLPRLVDMSLVFKQVVQSKDGVHYRSRRDLLASAQRGSKHEPGNEINPPIKTAYDYQRHSGGLRP